MPDHPDVTPPRLPLRPDEDGFHFFGGDDHGWSPVFWHADLQRFEGGVPGRGLRLETMEEACGPYLGRAVLVTQEEADPGSAGTSQMPDDNRLMATALLGGTPDRLTQTEDEAKTTEAAIRAAIDRALPGLVVGDEE